jgi:hypothetical protein
VLGQLRRDVVRGREAERLKRLVALAHQQIPVQPQHGAGEERRRQQQQRRVPDGEPCAKRERHDYQAAENRGLNAECRRTNAKAICL